MEIPFALECSAAYEVVVAAAVAVDGAEDTVRLRVPVALVPNCSCHRHPLRIVWLTFAEAPVAYPDTVVERQHTLTVAFVAVVLALVLEQAVDLYPQRPFPLDSDR